MNYWDKLAKLKKSNTGKGGNSASISMLYGPTFNTGYGADGQLQPDRPVAVDTSGREQVVLHEGEDVTNTPSGRLITPANMVMLNSESQQMDMAAKEKAYGLPGMKDGGFIESTNAYGNMSGINPLGPNRNTQATNTVAPQPQAPQSNAGVFGGSAFNPQPQSTGGAGLQTPAQTPAVPQAPVMPQAPMAQPLGMPQQAIQTGMQNLQGLATGQDSMYDQASNTMLGKVGAAQAAQTAAQQQGMAQAGVSQAQANVLGAGLDRTQALQSGQVAADVANAEAGLKTQASQELVNQGQALVSQAQNQINDLLSMGGDENIANAEQMASNLYGFDVDYSKAKVGDLQNNMANIEGWISQFGADASPGMLDLMGKKYFDAWTQSNAIQGLEFTPDETNVIMEGLMAGNVEQAEPALQLGAGVMDWWDAGDGSPLKMMLDGPAAQYQTVMSNPDAPLSEKAIASKALGEIVGAAYYAANGYGGYLTDAQKALLDQSGLGMLSGTQAEADAEAEETKVAVQEFKAGTRTDWENAVNNPEIWEQVKGSVSDIPVSGLSRTTDAYDGRNKVTTISQFDAFSEGRPYKVGDKVVVFTGRGVSTKGKDYATYSFKDPATGEAYSISLSGTAGRYAKLKSNIPGLKLPDKI